MPTNDLLLVIGKPVDDVQKSVVKTIIASDIANQRMLIEEPLQLNHVKAECAIICYFHKNEQVNKAREVLEINGMHPLAIQLVDLGLFMRLFDNHKVTDYTLAALHAYATKLRGSMPNKTILSIIPLRGNSLERRDFLKYMLRGFKTYRQLPIVMESCFAKNGCVSCVDACPYNAIRSDGNHIKVSSLSCVECGLCAVVCPEYHIQMPTFLEQIQQIVIDVLANSLQENDATVLFTCKYGFKMLQNYRKNMDKDFIPIMIPCISSFSHIALARARSQGLKIQLLCPEKKCEMRKGAEEYARLSAATFPDLTEVAITDGLDLDGLGRLQTKYDYDDVNFGSGKREVLSSIIAKHSDKEPISKCEGLPFFSVDLDQEMCTMCEACAVRCVPEALTIVKNHGKASLEFEHSKCTACMVCEDVCRPDAIKVVRDLNFKSINKKIVLKEEANSTCVVCGKGLDGSPETLKDTRQVEGSTVIQSVDYCEDCTMKLFTGEKC